MPRTDTTNQSSAHSVYEDSAPSPLIIEDQTRTTHRVIGAAPRGNGQAAANNGITASRQVTEVIDANKILIKASDIINNTEKNTPMAVCSPAILFEHNGKRLTIVGYTADGQKQKLQIDPQKKQIKRITRKNPLQLNQEVLYKEKNGKVIISQDNKLPGAQFSCTQILSEISRPTAPHNPSAQADGHYLTTDQKSYKLRLIAMANASRLSDGKHPDEENNTTYSYKLNSNQTPEFRIQRDEYDNIIRVNSDGHITIGSSLNRRTVEWDNSIAEIVVALEGKIKDNMPVKKRAAVKAGALLVGRDGNLMTAAAAAAAADQAPNPAHNLNGANNIDREPDQSPLLRPGL